MLPTRPAAGLSRERRRALSLPSFFRVGVTSRSGRGAARRDAPPAARTARGFRQAQERFSRAVCSQATWGFYRALPRMCTAARVGSRPAGLLSLRRSRTGRAAVPARRRRRVVARAARVLEPQGELIALRDIDVLVVPALAVDLQGRGWAGAAVTTTPRWRRSSGRAPPWSSNLSLCPRSRWASMIAGRRRLHGGAAGPGEERALKVPVPGDIVGKPGRAACATSCPSFASGTARPVRGQLGEFGGRRPGSRRKARTSCSRRGWTCSPRQPHLEQARDPAVSRSDRSRQLRPANYPDGAPGRGHAVVTSRGGSKLWGGETWRAGSS